MWSLEYLLSSALDDLSNSAKVSADSSCGAGALQLVVSSRKAGERLVAVDPHLHLKLLLSVLGR
jgi:hypothetical protein